MYFTETESMKSLDIPLLVYVRQTSEGENYDYCHSHKCCFKRTGYLEFVAFNVRDLDRYRQQIECGRKPLQPAWGPPRTAIRITAPSASTALA
jgi:hypothetical protein